MKWLGLLGGMSWESTALYYRLLNEGVRERLGGLHSARCLLWSVDFAEVERLQMAGEWEQAGAMLADGARRLQGAGAEAIVLCTNTMHLVSEPIEQAVDVPLLHILDATALAIREAGLGRVGLLGTRFTMEQPYFAERFAGHGVEALVPEAAGRDVVHRVIYEELVQGVVRDASRVAYVAQIDALAARGAEGVVLGCTEIGLLIGADDSSLPVFDTTAIHVAHALAFSIG